MNNFKSGSGNLDFGEDDDDESEDSDSSDESAVQSDASEAGPRSSTEPPTSQSADRDRPDASGAVERSGSEHGSDAPDPTSGPSSGDYPYFVRRNNVGDERDTRLEIHVRDKVAQQEATYRNELAEHLNTPEVSKTDAREFALLAAFQHPERVAELMQDEGYGALD